MDVEVLDVIGAVAALHSVGANHAPFRQRTLYQRTKLDGTVRHLQVAQRPAHVPAVQPEQRTRLVVDQHHVALDVNCQLGDRAGLQSRLAESARLRRGLALPRSGQRQRFPGEVGSTGETQEHAVLHVERREQVDGREQHLGLAQEQEPTLVQGEVEAREDLRLGLGVEVHEGVAAREEIEARDRRVAGDVMAAEDHPAAEVAAEDEAGAAGLEVAIAECGVDALEPLGGIGACSGHS